jgi:hypothetical protein
MPIQGGPPGAFEPPRLHEARKMVGTDKDFWQPLPFPWHLFGYFPLVLSIKRRYNTNKIGLRQIMPNIQ